MWKTSLFFRLSLSLAFPLIRHRFWNSFAQSRKCDWNAHQNECNVFRIEDSASKKKMAKATEKNTENSDSDSKHENRVSNIFGSHLIKYYEWEYFEQIFVRVNVRFVPKTLLK